MPFDDDNDDGPVSDPQTGREDDGHFLNGGSVRRFCDHEHHDEGERCYPPGLTRNETMVFDALSDCVEPLKAYDILDDLKERGVRAPMTVYRALDGLESKGIIHKLEALNAFMLCNHTGPHDVQVFLVCDVCSAVKEIAMEDLGSWMSPSMRKSGFAMASARVEVRGACADCAGAAGA